MIYTDTLTLHVSWEINILKISRIFLLLPCIPQYIKQNLVAI